MMKTDHAKESVFCDICNSGSHELLFAKEGFRHVRCNTCGLVFVNPRLKEHLVHQQVSGTGSMGENELTPAQVRRLDTELDRIKPYRRLNRILEVGAGRGWFLDRAAKSGWETWAVEVNQDAIRQLRTKGVAEIIIQPAEEFEAPPDYFDAVRMWDVIEHLKSPRKAMTNVHKVLRTGGFLKLATTNFASLSRKVNGPEWVYLNGADHIVLFEPATITRLLSEIGFSSIKIRTKSFNLRRKLYFPERELPPPSTILRPFRKLIDEAVRFTLAGHQMLVTAVKA